MLLVNRTIRALHVGCNDIGPRGTAAIADALKTTKSLASLQLWERMGDEGALTLADALSRASICELSLRTCLSAAVCRV